LLSSREELKLERVKLVVVHAPGLGEDMATLDKFLIGSHWPRILHWAIFNELLVWVHVEMAVQELQHKCLVCVVAQEHLAENS
jgi:hypothetical protein